MPLRIMCINTEIQTKLKLLFRKSSLKGERSFTAVHLSLLEEFVFVLSNRII